MAKQSNNQDKAPTKKVKKSEETNFQALEDIANLMRIDCVNMTTASKSGHPTSCASCADFVSVLFFHSSGMHYFPQDPKHFLNDRLVLSKGHAAPILYSAWAKAGYLDESRLLTLRKINSDIEGHPTPVMPFVDCATGSLGQGLGVACGMAYSSKYFDKISNRYYVILGDAETQEGSIWEAANFASHYKLDNVCAFVDCNRYGQSQIMDHTKQVLDTYKDRWEAFGWAVVVIDGHDVQAIVKALEKAKKCKDKPFVIIGKTFKGRNFGEGVENNFDYHGKPLGDKAQSAISHLRTLIKDNNAKLTPSQPNAEGFVLRQNTNIDLQLTDYTGKELPTRFGYGNALKSLGDHDSHGQIVGLDADLKNSTFAQVFQKAHPSQFIECFIAEQNMVSVASGVQARNRVPFCSTFASFMTRCYDQIRMAGISQLNIKFCGSHCGTSLGEDGSSQMGLEDLSLFRSIPNSIVLYPSDPISTEKATKLAANTQGLFYIRTSRFPTKALYGPDESFEVGKSKIVAQSPSDSVLVVAAGVTLFEALKAQETLKSHKIHVRVMDLFSVKPIDREALLSNASQCRNQILTVEDHYKDGGIHEAVTSALSETNIKVYGLYVNRIPKSGQPLELFDLCGISAKHIVEKVQKL